MHYTMGLKKNIPNILLKYLTIKTQLSTTLKISYIYKQKFSVLYDTLYNGIIKEIKYLTLFVNFINKENNILEDVKNIL